MEFVIYFGNIDHVEWVITEVRMNKIQKISSYLFFVFNMLIVRIPLFLTMQWIFISLKRTDVSNVINFFGMLEKRIQTPEGYVNLSNISWTLF